MATRANAAVNVCDGTRLRPENIQAAYAGSEENREPLSLTTVEQDASTSWNRRDGKCLLSGSLPGEPKGYFRETPVRHSARTWPARAFPLGSLRPSSCSAEGRVWPSPLTGAAFD